MHHVLTVEGMTCGHCEKAVTKAVLRVDPQAQVRIDRSANRVEVDSDTEEPRLRAAIAEEGYAIRD
jgi:copper chaperone